MRLGEPGPSTGVFRADERGLHVFVDQRWCEITGLTARQATGEGWVQAVRAEDRERVLQHWGEAVAAKTAFQCEYRTARDDALVLSRAEVATGLHGKLQGFIGSISDVSALRERQIELEHCVAQLSATLECMRDGILVLDHFGRQQTCNAKFFELLGIPRAEEINAQTLSLRIMQKLRNPHDCRANISELQWQPDAESECILELNDGRTLLLSSRPQRIHGRNAGRVWSFRDITEIKQAEARLASRAYHDPLTELPNRHLLFDRMSQAIALANRDRKKFAVLFIDLDHFKKINDRLGHFAADRMLKETARRICKCVREMDTVARIGGDEFVVLLTVVNQARDAGEVAAKILASLSMPFEDEARVSASIGISIFENDDEDGEALLQRADAAMYYAKRCGRNRFRYYNSSINE
jgi:diguanylate cyclase (GGDEF)-like protein/PAS domain S-box-containing protein